MERRLAAILVADIVGYSRLMNEDEEGTHRAVRDTFKSLIDPKLAQYRGRIIKLTGDGALIEFASAVDAVAFAVEVQSAMQERNCDVAEERRIEYRIGINIGDIIIEADDFYGDGVNIAARIEGLADLGGICVARNVFEHVKNKLDVRFEDMGKQELKNIPEAVRVYRVVMTGQGDGLAVVDKDQTLPLPDKPSIAVLPFENLSGDPEQEYFVDGMAEDIITSLSKLPQLFVIARNSSFIYKGMAVKVQQVGEELGVQYLLEGGVRKAGNKVRITTQLIDCRSGGHLWADKFDRELTDVFAVQDEVTRSIVSALALNLTAEEEGRMKHVNSDSVEAYDCYLRGRSLFYLRSKEGISQAKVMFKRATDLDPTFSSAYSTLSTCHVMDYINGWCEQVDQSLEQAYEVAQKAVALDETNPLARVSLGNVHIWKRQHDRAVAELERAIALEPNFANSHIILGWILHFVGRSEEGIEAINRGVRLDPLYQDIYLHWLAAAHFQLGRYEEASELLKRRIFH
jgi:adenylate cyclase